MNSVLVRWLQARIEASLNFVCREDSQRSCGQWSDLQKLMVMGRWIFEQLELVVMELGSTLLYRDRNENHDEGIYFELRLNASVKDERVCWLDLMEIGKNESVGVDVAEIFKDQRKIKSVLELDEQKTERELDFRKA
ncbi:hypothetical protein C5167_031184 [Papaver somniferum]|nr:hypothetical protein C5167_031184 [Papaver somniferum]